jgi:hypothetical protein
MLTTPDNTATNWRDLADQLTPEQIEKLARMEQRSRMTADETAGMLLVGARELATGNVVDQVAFGGIEPPSDATRCCIEEGGAGAWVRSFDGTARKVDDAEVFISGRQFEDGRTVREIGIDARGDYDAATARRIAAIEAADEIEGLR